jgi:serine/threonine protein kinase
MNVKYLNEYDLNTKLQFDFVDENSSEVKIKQLFDLLLAHQMRRNLLFGEYDFVTDYDIFKEKILDDTGTFYFVYKDKILYSYIKTLGNINLYMISIISSTNKIVQNITYLLLDYIVYINSNLINKLIISIPDSSTQEYLENWMFSDKIYSDVQIEWGNVKNPDLNLRYDLTKNNLQFKFIECFEQWRTIFNIKSVKSPKNKNNLISRQQLKSPDYENKTTTEFNHIKFVEVNGKKLVCKVSRSDNDDLINIREIIYYKNCNFPYIPKISKIDKFEFCLPKYSPLNVNKSNVKDFLRQMLLSLDYLHKKGIFHQDIKPLNMLQDNQGNFYLIDFGISQYYGHNNSMKNYFSTHGFVVEDIYMNNDKNLDLFQLAISVIQIFTGHPTKIKNKTRDIFESSTDVINYLPYLKKKLIEEIGNDGYNLIYDMLGLNGSYISAEKALNHSFFNKKYLGLIKEFKDIDINFPKSHPFVDITLHKNVSLTDYKNVIKIIVEYLIQQNYFYLTFLLIVQIFRKTINKIVIKDIDKLELYGIASMIIGCIILETDQQIIESLDNFSFDTNTIHDAVIKILKVIDYDIEFISYDIGLNVNKENTIVDLVYILTFCNSNNNENLETLSEIINTSQSSKKYNIPDNIKYDKKLSVLENIKRML